ncbi:copper homeostasis membrane protein CopD [Sphingomonas oryzagri]
MAVVAARLGLYLTLAVVLGLPCFSLWTRRDARRRSAVPVARIVGVAALLAIALSAFQLIALAASMSGTPLKEVDRATIAMLLESGAMALAWKIRVGALLVVLIASTLAKPMPNLSRILSVSSGGMALATMAWFGHGAVHAGMAGWVHLVADIAHLWAAGIWAGALVSLSWMLLSPPAGEGCHHAALCEQALADFAGLGTAIVLTLVATGLVNAWFLIGVDHIRDLASDPYGRLLLFKLALFGVMLLLAASNRYRLTPALGRALAGGGSPARSLGRLRVSLLTETVVMALILGLVAWFGTLSPPAGS